MTTTEQTIAVLGQRIDTVEDRVDNVDRTLSDVLSRLARGDVHLDQLTSELRELRADVRWVRDRMIALLALTGLVSGVSGALIQWGLSHLTMH